MKNSDHTVSPTTTDALKAPTPVELPIHHSTHQRFPNPHLKGYVVLHVLHINIIVSVLLMLGLGIQLKLNGRDSVVIYKNSLSG